VPFRTNAFRTGLVPLFQYWPNSASVALGTSHRSNPADTLPGLEAPLQAHWKRGERKKMKGSPRSAWLLLAMMVALTTVVRLMLSQRTRLDATSPSADAEQGANDSTSIEATPAEAKASEPGPTGRSGRKTRSISFAVATALMVAAMGAGTVFASDAPDATVAHDAQHPNGNTNETPFWEWYFENKFPNTTWECTKVNEPVDPTITDVEDAVIIKAATTNYVWWDDPTTLEDELHSGTYTAPENSTSHYLTCVNTTGPVEDIVVDPKGDIRGPCADPAYFAVFDNTASTVDVTFRFRWYNFNGIHVVMKTVPAGSYFITTQKWVKAYTTMRIGYKDPDTGVWMPLVNELSGKGRYPACTAESHGYIPGFGTGTVPADPSLNP